MDEVSSLDQQTLGVYRAILFHKEHDPKRLASLLDCTPEAVEAALDRLSELALLAPSTDSPGRLRAVNPSLGLKVLLQREQNELAWRQQRIEQNRAALAALAAEYTASGWSNTLDGTEHLDNVDDIRIRLEALAESCVRESLAFHPVNALTQESIEAGRPLNERALARGVRFRSIYLDSVANDRVTKAHAQWMAERHSEIRTSPTLPMRLLIVDNTAAIVAGLPGQAQPSALLFSSQPVVLAMRALFEAYWEHSCPLDRPGDALPGGLTPQERKLLQLLATGLTDEAVARALGIGVRTERRIMAELMERLGASSRFEAGVQATRREWI
ncbi:MULTISPECIES: helix-turn-helix transcriptional regulator [unclassified Streptomyces]|uniref:helix-turn-helix transcriptional regulator n=1 Tax=unclassified Streptomyces TaxID=2593676 RepID=UPI002251CB82|nr:MULTISPECIES: helix-turn-helix transcriptional regulator [unclassified Streptomyces]MCX5440236.1 helix-turn-helix transcriptional regulator [Streptomyces sp. NBC_00063]WSE17746.1 helix-turn-helix transcriptional regulator [Streptomyces sp. NBC_01397]WUB93361.1 helix-turn-helix transcriptional regulator [Streptomyces sp. NBC_00569]